MFGEEGVVVVSNTVNKEVQLDGEIRMQNGWRKFGEGENELNALECDTCEAPAIYEKLVECGTRPIRLACGKHVPLEAFGDVVVIVCRDPENASKYSIANVGDEQVRAAGALIADKGRTRRLLSLDLTDDFERRRRVGERS